VVQNALNQRPRKTLGFRTPNESHFEERLWIYF
jgi:IS30 family transposase